MYETAIYCTKSIAKSEFIQPVKTPYIATFPAFENSLIWQNFVKEISTKPSQK